MCCGRAADAADPVPSPPQGITLIIMGTIKATPCRTLVRVCGPMLRIRASGLGLDPLCECHAAMLIFLLQLLLVQNFVELGR